MGVATAHSAEASALGFYFQSFFGLSQLVGYGDDAAAVAIERGDDVEVQANTETLLYQLKHSMSAKPATVTLASRALWRTLKVWIDLLPQLTLAQTTFHLVTVGELSKGSELQALLSETGDRKSLVAALEKEAKRVLDERAAAIAAETSPLPHADRADGCSAFLDLSPAQRLNLLRRVRVTPGALTIDQMEAEIAGKLIQVKQDDRLTIAKSLIEWWDRQVIFSLCGKRPRFITRGELLQEVAEHVADLQREMLIPEFSTSPLPVDYAPDGMLTRQIRLVGGQPSDISKAIREEWRAREQRAKWVNERPGMAARIGHHDAHLKEEWSDLHTQIQEDCAGLEEEDMCKRGLDLLRWSHDEAHRTVQPIAGSWAAPYYVRGSYQVLAINRDVGWHPDYLKRLEDQEGGT